MFYALIEEAKNDGKGLEKKSISPKKEDLPDSMDIKKLLHLLMS